MLTDATSHRLLRRIDVLLCSPWFPVVLAVVAGAIAVVVTEVVYPNLSWNRDEVVYQWQTSLLLDGELTSADGGYPALFHPWLSGHRDGVFFTQYPLGWPLVMAVGEAVGWAELSLVIASAVAVVGTYVLAHELTQQRRIAAIAGLFLVTSPLLAVQSGLYLTYLFTLGLGTLFSAAMLSGVRQGSRWRMLVGGVLLGWIVATRTYDAVVWAAVIGGFIVIVERKRWRALARLLVPFLIGVVPVVVMQLLHNRHLTGHPLEFPISVADPMDSFGFGQRRLMPGLDPYAYGVGRATVGTAKHLFFLPWFLTGAYLGAAMAAYGAFGDRKKQPTWLLVALCVAFPLAYFPFWGVHVSSLTTRISGPIYYVPVYAPLCILAAIGLVRAGRRFPRATAVGVVAALMITVPVTIGRLGLNRHLSRVQEPWAASVADLDGPAIVAISPSPYLGFLNPVGVSRADQDDDIVFTTDLDASLIRFIDEHPERSAWLQRATVPAAELAPSEHTKAFDVEVVPLEIVRGPALALKIDAVARRSGATSVVVSIGTDLSWSVPSQEVAEGEVFTTSIVMSNDPSIADEGGLYVPEGSVPVEVTAGVGGTEEEAAGAPTVRYRFLLDSASTMRALQPGRFYRPDPKGLAKGEVWWRDDVDRGDVDVTVEPAAAS